MFDKFRKVLALGAATGLSLTAFAGGAAAQVVNCSAPGTQFEINQCSARDHAVVDAQLNAAYKQVAARFRELDGGKQGEGSLLLRDGQRAWITFRDKTCAAEAHLYNGGSMQPYIRNACLTRLTQQRLRDLETLAAEFAR